MEKRNEIGLFLFIFDGPHFRERKGTLIGGLADSLLVSTVASSGSFGWWSLDKRDEFPCLVIECGHLWGRGRGYSVRYFANSVKLIRFMSFWHIPLYWYNYFFCLGRSFFVSRSSKFFVSPYKNTVSPLRLLFFVCHFSYIVLSFFLAYAAVLSVLHIMPWLPLVIFFSAFVTFCHISPGPSFPIRFLRMLSP